MEPNKEGFRFTYSAKEQDEIKKIREKYMPETEDKLAQLRRLDRNVTRKGTAVSITVGSIGSLILGIGMSTAMMAEGKWFIPGVIVGVVGIAVIAVAYPLYKFITRKERERIAPEILRLSEELMK